MKNFSAACLASVLVCTVTARKQNLKISKEDLVFEESWTDVHEESARESHERRHHVDVLIDENKRPVFGVLTEPIRG